MPGTRRAPWIGAAIFGLILAGFSLGWTRGQGPAEPRSALFSIDGSLPAFEFREGSAPPLSLHLRSAAPIPRDLFLSLRLHCAVPGGLDAGRVLIDPEQVAIHASDDGRDLRLIVPISAFLSDQDETFTSFALLAPGEHEFVISILDPRDYLSGRAEPRRIRSSPIPAVVVPFGLETVLHHAALAISTRLA